MHLMILKQQFLGVHRGIVGVLVHLYHATRGPHSTKTKNGSNIRSENPITTFWRSPAPHQDTQRSFFARLWQVSTVASLEGHVFGALNQWYSCRQTNLANFSACPVEEVVVEDANRRNGGSEKIDPLPLSQRRTRLGDVLADGRLETAISRVARKEQLELPTMSPNGCHWKSCFGSASVYDPRLKQATPAR